MEHVIPGIIDLVNEVNSPETFEIRRMPDFVIQNKENFHVHFIEVKYRESEDFNWKNFDKIQPNPKAFIIVVSKKHIKCLTAKELEEGKSISPKCTNYLGNRSEFILNCDIIKEYCKLAEKFFDGVE